MRSSKSLCVTTSIFAALLGMAADCAAAEDVSNALQGRANQIAILFRPDPRGYEAIFSKEFLSQVPPAQITAILADYSSRLGRCTKAILRSSVGPYQGKFDLLFEKGFRASADIAVDPASPHLVVGLLIGTPVRLSSSFDELIKEMKSLPGAVSFRLARLESARTETIADLDPDKPLAIGSSMKLYILAELVRSIEASERKWSDVVTLQPEAFSLPSGFLQKWPAGAPLTLHTLAALMISQSDNTAADQLLRTLGRENVEKILALAGQSHPERNMPFLSTLEASKLKGDSGGQLVGAYVSKDAGTRRALLQGVVAQMPRDAIGPSAPNKPSHIDTVEWFASASDLCRVMDWMRTHTEKKPAVEAREVLAINRGLAISDKDWPYVGYKGGSEPGVLNLTFLLLSSKGQWYALSATWNDPNAPLEEKRFLEIVQQIVQLIPAQ